MTRAFPVTAFKILTAAQWSDWQANGTFRGAPIDLNDGFIHLSAADQVLETLAVHFRDQNEPVIVEVDLMQLGGALKWEPSRGGALFPHVYAAIPLKAVSRLMSLDDFRAEASQSCR